MAKYLLITSECDIEHFNDMVTKGKKYLVCAESHIFYYIEDDDGDRLTLDKGGYDVDYDLRYEVLVDEEVDETVDESSEESARYSKYFKDVSELDVIDVYQTHKLFDIDDPSGAIQHASKKLLLSGVRTGGKSKYDDIKEARDTLNRWLVLNDSQSV